MTGPGDRRGRLADAGRRYGAVAALAGLVAANALHTPNFATAGNLQNVLVQAAAAVLVGAGMTLVLATGGVDLSVGSVMAAAAAAAVVGADRGGTAGGLAAGLATGAGLGLVNGLLVARAGIEPFIATLGTMIAVRGLAQPTAGGAGTVPLDDPGLETLVGKGAVGPVPVGVAFAAGAVLAAGVVVRMTPLGRYLVAVGGNRAAARAAGVPVGRTVVLAFAASGFLAGLAGLAEAARLGAADPVNLGGNMEFVAIAGAVIGGTPLHGGRARPAGTAVGVLILAVIAASFNMLLVPFAWGLVLQAGIILAAVAVQRPRRA